LILIERQREKRKKESSGVHTVFVENGRKSSEGDREGDRGCFGVREKEERKNSRRCWEWDWRRQRK
jgi:hypothetical protein